MAHPEPTPATHSTPPAGPPAGEHAAAHASSGADAARTRRRAGLSGFLFGCGIAAAMIDLFIFHLGLQWHHFYDLSTHEVALVTDGFFHAFGWFITVWGLFLLADVRRRGGVHWPYWAGAVVLGVGAFQLFDGIVDHKLLGIHQIRYGVDLLPYDLVWNGTAVLLILLGYVLMRRGGRAHPRA
ncbi:DUF2243 domain-containing protein [Kocuria tytonicola]|uniref:DUF2243 domain-containing protein n=1 Tax=Kocuria tytonicola TaxID=2055946 RepID=A0A3L9LAK4_9MICC|nr:DUF2243 domain-containing protein [Kocuria tytonicola]RLY94117.1 DUF2243 domain-containing protein [Kocuria tytonicola]